MATQAVQFPFVETDPRIGPASQQPLMPFALSLQKQMISVSGLVDSGASINVLPCQVGDQFGIDWDQLTTSLSLTGNLAAFPAKALLLSATIALFDPVNLIFAWTKATNVPVILGQINYFLEFDVCFFRSRSLFEVKPKQTIP